MQAGDTLVHEFVWYHLIDHTEDPSQLFFYSSVVALVSSPVVRGYAHPLLPFRVSCSGLLETFWQTPMTVTKVISFDDPASDVV